MLDIITKSKNRKKILQLLFLSEGKEFYLSEIAAKLSISNGNAQRELKKLVDSGIAGTRKVANLRYYYVDKKNTLHKALRQIILKTIGIEASLKELLAGVKGINYAFLFGSYVKDSFNSQSDIDLCVIGKAENRDLIKKINQLEQSTGREINFVEYNKKEFINNLKDNSFIKDIIQSYILLIGNKDEFKQLLQKKN